MAHAQDWERCDTIINDEEWKEVTHLNAFKRINYPHTNDQTIQCHSNNLCIFNAMLYEWIVGYCSTSIGM
jgi:hypothetical protein